MRWESVQFGSICHLVNGKAFKPSDWSPTGVPIIRIQNLNEPDKHFNFWAGPLEGQVRVKHGSLLLAWSGTPGTSFGAHIWLGGDSILNQHIFRCDIDETRVTKEWAKFAVNTQLNRLIERAHGGVGLKHVTREVVVELEIPLPPLPEQRRIAEILDKAEALRVKRRAALALLDTLTQAIFLDMFGDPATNPKGVSMEPLGKHLRFVTSGSRGWADFYAPAGTRFIRSLDVQMNYVGNDDVAFVAAPDNAEARRTRVKAGDVLLTITGSRIGRVAPVPNDLEGSYISQHVAILRVEESLQPIYLSCFLSSEVGGQRQIAKAQYGQTKPGLNFEQIRRFFVPVPRIELQREFVRRVAAVEKLKATHRASLAGMDELFLPLQHRAFRGEL